MQHAVFMAYPTHNPTQLLEKDFWIRLGLLNCSIGVKSRIISLFHNKFLMVSMHTSVNKLIVTREKLFFINNSVCITVLRRYLNIHPGLRISMNLYLYCFYACWITVYIHWIWHDHSPRIVTSNFILIQNFAFKMCFQQKGRQWPRFKSLICTQHLFTPGPFKDAESRYLSRALALCQAIWSGQSVYLGSTPFERSIKLISRCSLCWWI